MAGQIFEEGPLAVPALYTVPGNQTISPLSITATLDGSGASGAFLACVSIYSQTGALIARVPTSQSIAAGDSSEVTWAPFLRVASTAPAPTGTSLPWGLAAVDALSVASGASFTIVDFATSGASQAFGSSGDGVVTLGDVGGGTTGMILNQAAVYLVSWHVSASNNGAPAANSTIQLQCDFDTSDPTVGSNYGSAFVVSAGPNKQYDAGYQDVLNLAPANYPIPNTGRLLVRQNTGLVLSCYIRMFAVLVSTITDPNVF